MPKTIELNWQEMQLIYEYLALIENDEKYDEKTRLIAKQIIKKLTEE